MTEGHSLTLDASASTDANGYPLTYSWIINSQANAASGVQPTVTWAQLAALGIDSRVTGFLVAVQADDCHGTTVVSRLTSLNVADAPLVIHPTATVFSTLEGQAVTNVVLGTFTDPFSDDNASEYTATIDWGDGSTQDAAGAIVDNGKGNFTVLGSHLYAEDGAYGISITIKHDGFATTATGAHWTSNWTPTYHAHSGAAAGTDGNIYVVGGYPYPWPNSYAGSALNSLEEFNPTTQTWTSLPSMPTARANVAVAGGNDGRIYVFGGNDSKFQYLNTAEAYDPTTRSWKELAAMPVSGVVAAAAGTDGKIYVFDGPSGTWAYDPTGDSWTRLPDSPSSSQGIHVAAAATGPDSKIYLFGGGNSYGYGGATAEAYDPATQTWATLPDMPVPRAGANAVTGTDGCIYVLGGQTASSTTVEAYDPVSQTWTTVPSGPLAIDSINLGTAAARGGDGQIYVFSRNMQETFHPGSFSQVIDAPIQASGSFFSVQQGTGTGGITIATLTDQAGLPADNDYYVSVDWGDNRSIGTVTVQPTGHGPLNIQGNHTYQAEGVYTVSIKIFDDGTSPDGLPHSFAATTSTASVYPVATHFRLSAAGPATSGSPVALTITALDASGNVDTGYIGSVTLSSTDPAAPRGETYSYYSFSGFNQGVLTINVTQETVGSQTITASDTLFPSVAGSTSVSVNPRPVSWTGAAGDGNWDTAGNWSINAVPGPNDAVNIDNTYELSPFTVTHSTAADSVYSLTSQDALVLSGGSLSIAAASVVNNSFTLSGGTLGGPGALTVNAGSTLSGGTLDGAKLVIGTSKTAVLTGDVQAVHGAVLENDGTLSEAADVTILSGDSTSVFNNYGTFQKTAGGAPYTADAWVDMVFNNYGTLDVQQGELVLGAGGAPNFYSSGTVEVASHALATFQGAATFAAGSVTTGGMVEFLYGRQFLDGTVTFQPGSVYQAEQTVLYDATVSMAGTVESLGGLWIVSSGLDLSAASVAPAATTLPNLYLYAGTLDGPQAWTVTGSFGRYGTLSGGGSLTAEGCPTPSSPVADDFRNSSFVVDDGTILNGLTLDDYTLAVPPGASATLYALQAVHGAVLVNGGKINDTASGPLLDGDGTGTLVEEISNTTQGTQYGLITAPSGISLAGGLQVFLNGFAPHVGDQFTVIADQGSNQVNSTFAGLPEGAQFVAGGYLFQISYAGGSSGRDVVLTAIRVATTTAVTASADPSAFGQGVTFTATVTPNTPGAATPTGSVKFVIDGQNYGTPVALSSGTASVTDAALAVGSHTIAALYSGDANSLPSDDTAAPLIQVVNKADTTTTVASSVNPSIYGRPVTFTATVTVKSPGSALLASPTGIVTFYDNGTGIGTGTLSIVGGLTTASLTTSAYQLSVAGHTITAAYTSGDGNFNVSPASAPLTQNVHYNFSGFLAPLNKAAPTGSLGKQIPIKFQLKDFNGNLVSFATVSAALSAVPSLQVQVVDSKGNPLGSPTTPASNTGLSYDPPAQMFTFNWQTKGLSAGFYEILLALNDGTVQTKIIQLTPTGKPAGLTTSAAGGTGATGTNALLAGNIELYVDNSNSNLTADELARIHDAVTAVDAVTEPYGVAVQEVTDPTLADVTLNMDTTGTVGGYGDGVLGCTTDDGQITIIQGWNFYGGSDATQIDPAQYDFETVVTHELGHALGLGHSNDSTSVMYASLGTGEVRRTMVVADLNVADTAPGADGLHVTARSAMFDFRFSISDWKTSFANAAALILAHPLPAPTGAATAFGVSRPGEPAGSIFAEQARETISGVRAELGNFSLGGRPAATSWFAELSGEVLERLFPSQATGPEEGWLPPADESSEGMRENLAMGQADWRHSEHEAANPSEGGMEGEWSSPPAAAKEHKEPVAWDGGLAAALIGAGGLSGLANKESRRRAAEDSTIPSAGRNSCVSRGHETRRKSGG
jgi:N-acetylneuraminic acid mutarotase